MRTVTRPPAATVTFLVTGAVAAVLTACAGPSEEGDDRGGVIIRGEQQGTYLGTDLRTPYEKPKIVLTDTSGEPFDFAADTTHPVTLVFFGYTNCPDVCYTELADLALALRKVAPAVREATEVVFVTTDPARDTPAVMAAYLERFGFPAYVGLTGPIDVIVPAGYDLGIAIADGKKLPGGGYEVAHGAQVIGFGPDGTAPVFWNDMAPDDMARDITLLAGSA